MPQTQQKTLIKLCYAVPNCKWSGCNQTKPKLAPTHNLCVHLHNSLRRISHRAVAQQHNIKLVVTTGNLLTLIFASSSSTFNQLGRATRPSIHQYSIQRCYETVRFFNYNETHINRLSFTTHFQSLRQTEILSFAFNCAAVAHVTTCN